MCKKPTATRSRLPPSCADAFWTRRQRGVAAADALPLLLVRNAFTWEGGQGHRSPLRLCSLRLARASPRRQLLARRLLNA
eukprot:8360318-Alexandrium_andersonii.AAC.1